MLASIKPSAQKRTGNALYIENLKASQEAYAEEKYDEARNYISIACNAFVGASIYDRIRALDLKCAILVKLNKLDMALETAKLIIRADKQNARGYCRAASVEKLRGDFLNATKYLEHGEARVSDSDTLRSYLVDQLASARETLNQRKVKEKPMDPTSVFPLEVFQIIISYLNYQQVVLLTRVSKNWKRILCMLEPLLTTLDFRTSEKQISSLMLKAALDRLFQPKVVAIYNVLPSTTGQLTKAFKHPTKFSLLKYLALNNANMPFHWIPFDRFSLRTIHVGIHSEIGIGQVFHIINTCPLLEEARFRRVKMSIVDNIAEHKNLVALHLGNPFDLSSFSIPAGYFSNYPNLESLIVHGAAVSKKASWDLSKNVRLRHLDTFASVIRTIRLPPSLEEWLWDGTQAAQFVNTRETLSIAESLPNLRSICLSGGNTLAVLEYLYASQPINDQIHRVGLNYRQSLDLLVGTEPRYQLISQARELSFECEVLRDSDHHQFVSRFPDVEVLYLAAPLITGVFIADLLKRPGNKIRKVVLKNCCRVSPDTVAWVRAQKVEIDAEAMMISGEPRLHRSYFKNFCDQNRD